MELQELKNYLRVDSGMDDFLLLSLQLSAETYILNAVENIEKVKQDERFNLAVALLVGSWYKNREAISDGAVQEIPFGVASLIGQLRGV